MPHSPLQEPANSSQSMAPTKRSRSWRGLIVADGFAGVSALLGMVILFSSWPIKFPVSELRNTPFSDYKVPALILGLVVGGSALLALWTMLRHPAIGPLFSLIAGGIMMGWIFGEVTLMETNLFTDFAMAWAQLEYFLLGVLMVVLAVLVTPDGLRGMWHQFLHLGKGSP